MFSPGISRCLSRGVQAKILLEPIDAFQQLSLPLSRGLVITNAAVPHLLASRRDLPPFFLPFRLVLQARRVRVRGPVAVRLSDVISVVIVIAIAGSSPPLPVQLRLGGRARLTPTLTTAEIPKVVAVAVAVAVAVVVVVVAVVPKAVEQTCDRMFYFPSSSAVVSVVVVVRVTGPARTSRAVVIIIVAVAVTVAVTGPAYSPSSARLALALVVGATFHITTRLALVLALAVSADA